MNTHGPSFDIRGNDRPQSTPGLLGCSAALRATAVAAVALAALVGFLATEKTPDAAGGSDVIHSTANASQPEAAQPGAYVAP